MPRILVAGLGRIGSLDDLGNTSLARSHIGVALDCGWHLAALVDPSASARQAAMTQWQPGDDTRFVADMSDLQAGIADVIVLATPTDNHAADLRKALALQPGCILLEKPLANDPETAAEIGRLTADSTIPVYVNYMRRYAPAIQDALCARQHMPVLVEATIGGGVLNMASHYIDLLVQHYGKPLRVMATSPETGGRADDPGHGFVMEFNTFRAHFAALPPTGYGMLEMRLYYDDARLEIRDNGLRQYCQIAEKDHLFPGYHHLGDGIETASRDLGMHGLYAAMAKSLSDDGQTPVQACSIDQALVVLKACLAVRESAANNNCVISL